MKRTIITSVIVIILAACNQEKQNTTHEAMEHKAGENVMMQAMDESMTAMHNAKQIGNPDYDFASMMLPHHEGAIIMAEAIIKDSKSEFLVAFAKKVILAQRKEIKQFQSFLKNASQLPAKDADQFKKAMNDSRRPMMNGMSNVKLTGNIDEDFVALMIPHHQSAVDMAKAYLPYARNDEIKNLAEQIKTSQTHEIEWLQKQ